MARGAGHKDEGTAVVWLGRPPTSQCPLVPTVLGRDPSTVSTGSGGIVEVTLVIFRRTVVHRKRYPDLSCSLGPGTGRPAGNQYCSTEVLKISGRNGNSTSFACPFIV